MSMKLMLVEDSPLEQQHISGYLQEWGLDFVCASNGADAWRVLQGPDAPRLVLLDWMLPEVDGLELCRRIRSLGSDGSYTYIVMLTALEKKANLPIAMAAGADDYLAKPVDPSELRARILVGKRIVELQQSLRFAATHDFLTGLLNREEILGCLKREASRAEREEKPLAIILADLDHFKQVNDLFGHAAGDAVLKEVARRLQKDLRAYDLVGRYGGEEFLLILPSCPLEVAVRRANEIRLLVKNVPVVTTSSTIHLSISMGVTVTRMDQPLTLENLLQQADSSLYAAKNKGRNRVEAFVSTKTQAAKL
jgi:two-component system cell cycle response regulator